MKKLLLILSIMLSGSMIFSQVELGGTTNYSEVEEDGTLEFHGDATVWNDYVVIPMLKVNQSSGPTWVEFRDGLFALAYDEKGMGQVFFDVQLPHTWKEGTTIYPHIHWSNGNDNSGGNIVWYLDYTWANYQDAFPSVTTINSGAVAVPTTLYEHEITEIPASGGIDGTGKTISSVLRCRLYRNPSGSDTYNGDAFALSIDIHYETNTVGSRQEFIK